MENCTLTPYFLSSKEIGQVALNKGFPIPPPRYLKTTMLFIIIIICILGLLIEPSKDYQTLLTRNRKVFSINACLSKESSPSVVEFLNHGAIGGIKGTKY